MNESTSQILNLSEYRSHQVRLFLFSVEKTLNDICDGVTIAEFTQMFQNIESLKNKQKNIFKMYTILKNQIVSDIINELKLRVDKDDLDSKFCYLNEIINSENINSSNQLTAVWRPPGNASEHIRSHLMFRKLKQKAILEQEVKEKEEHVKNLESKVIGYRQKGEKIYNTLSTLLIKENEKREQYEEKLKVLRSSIS